VKKYFRTIITVFLGMLITFILIACNNEQNDASKAIEAYIQALSNKDSAQISNLSCAEWEKSALSEVDSLTAVGSKIENLTCKETGQNGADSYVSCTGVLSLDYNGEAQQIDLSARTFIARNEGGEWRMCGYR